MNYKNLTHWSVLASFVVIVAAIVMGSRHPWVLVSHVHAPTERSVPLSNRSPILQEVVVASNTFSGVRFFVRDEHGSAPSTRLLLHVRRSPEAHDIRTVSTTWQAAAHHGFFKTDAFSGTYHSLYFPFERIDGTQRQSFVLLLEAHDVSPLSAIPLLYQIDSSKYEAGRLSLANHAKEGNLGFVLYESPSLAALAGRWLVAPNRWPALWAVGVIIACLGTLATLRYQKGVLPPPAAVNTYQRISWYELGGVSIFLVVLVLAVYWPALDVPFMQDDLDILLRTRELVAPHPVHLFTIYPYKVLGMQPTYPIGFYRPLSYSVYPWLLYHFFALHSPAYHLFNLILLAAVGVGIYYLTRLLAMRVLEGLLVAVIWLVHASKIPLAFWWSSAQDLLAAVTTIATLLIYSRLRVRYQRGLFVVWLFVFSLGLLSKEYVVLVPVAIIALELFFLSPKLTTVIRSLRSYLPLWLPLLILTALYIIARTAVMTDPTLPSTISRDSSYTISFHPAVLLRNLTIYSAWMAEQWLWPPGGGVEILLRSLARFPATPLPLYPAFLWFAATAFLLFFYWKKHFWRQRLLFAYSWWILFLLPYLFLANEQRPRWLTLAAWSGGVVIVAGIHMLWRPLQRVVVASVLSIGIIYGIWVTRFSPLIKEYDDVTRVVRSTLQQFETQRSRLTPASTVYFIGVAPERRGTPNASLLRLYWPDVPLARVIYKDDVPQPLKADDVVIDLRS